MKDSTVLTERNYNSYMAIIKQDGPWWIGWIEEIHGVNCQERSYEELITSLKETLTEALHLNREEALQDAGGNLSGRADYGSGMKRRLLIHHLMKQGCVLLREGELSLLVF